MGSENFGYADLGLAQVSTRRHQCGGLALQSRHQSTTLQSRILAIFKNFNPGRLERQSRICLSDPRNPPEGWQSVGGILTTHNENLQRIFIGRWEFPHDYLLMELFLYGRVEYEGDP
jgi:hypothetical protein